MSHLPEIRIKTSKNETAYIMVEKETTYAILFVFPVHDLNPVYEKFGSVHESASDAISVFLGEFHDLVRSRGDKIADIHFTCGDPFSLKSPIDEFLVSRDVNVRVRIN